MSTRPSADHDASTAFSAAVSSLKLSAPPPGFFDDPYPWFDALREHRPVHTLGPGSWLLTRYDDVLAVYRRGAVSSDKQREVGLKFGVGTPLHQHHTPSLVFNDPPRHTRVRRLMTVGGPAPAHAVPATGPRGSSRSPADPGWPQQSSARP